MPDLQRRRLAPFALAGCASLFLATGALPTAVAAGPDKTRVYVVVLDGLRPDEIALMPFLTSLADGGTHYTEARSVMVAETIPNHVASHGDRQLPRPQRDRGQQLPGAGGERDVAGR